MKTLPDKYEHSEAEQRWQQAWEENNVFRWEAALPREQTFVIDTPPPTVSGMLHMGHVFSYTQADFIARYQRMAGKTVFYPMGFDDNGLPTERLVEKEKKVRATDMSREDFIALCNGVSEEARKEFRNLFTSIALSVDWEQEYHTVSDQSRKISQLSFLDLARKDRAYRKLQPMLWDPVDQTAIAQAEVEDKEQPSFFNDIALAIDGSDEKITIATTRPELLAACVAIFYHPEDARYKHLKGKYAITPLFGVKVPVMEDDTVEPEKGTGIMMCCTFGDEADIEKWRKHNLPTRLVLNKYGKLHFVATEAGYEPAQQDGEAVAYSASANAAIEALQGLKTKAAREKSIELLKTSGDLLESKPIVHAVKCAERSGAPLEILPTYQWFVKVLDEKAELKAKAAECQWHPPYMRVRMDQWIDGLSWDWCISRQRYFGVPFPVWYVYKITYDTVPDSSRSDNIDAALEHEVVNVISREPDKVIFAKPETLPVNPLKDFPDYEWDDRYLIKKINLNGVRNVWHVHNRHDVKEGYIVAAEADVMDTWATSSISPQLSSRSINADLSDGDAERHAKLFPADLRPQAHEIIRTWAFYTLVKSHLHENTIPWKNVMISGWCLASDKTKMSKSKGNVVTPVDLVRDKGADVVRYWASTSRLGADTAFSEDVLKIGRKLVNKLWNATKFAAIHLNHLTETPQTAAEEVAAGRVSCVLDKWILTRLHRTIAIATKEFERYEYADARAAIEDFFWNDFCDNYLELVKNRVYGNDGTEADRLSAVIAIYHCLNGILRLFAPFVPHITEELYSHIFDAEYAQSGSLHARGSWPKAADFPCDADAETVGIDAVELLNVVRRLKSERNVSIKYPIERFEVVIQQQIYAQKLMLEEAFIDIKGASNSAEVSWGGTGVHASERLATTQSEDGKFTVALLFAEQSDVA